MIRNYSVSIRFGRKKGCYWAAGFLCKEFNAPTVVVIVACILFCANFIIHFHVNLVSIKGKSSSNERFEVPLVAILISSSSPHTFSSLSPPLATKEKGKQNRRKKRKEKERNEIGREKAKTGEDAEIIEEDNKARRRAMAEEEAA